MSDGMTEDMRASVGSAAFAAVAPAPLLTVRHLDRAYRHGGAQTFVSGGQQQLVWIARAMVASPPSSWRMSPREISTPRMRGRSWSSSEH
jgi:ABC-type histidine transport system ATPase subunit